MKKNWEQFKGVCWGELDDDTKNKLMSAANCVDARTGNTRVYGDCIIDFQGTSLSIVGRRIEHDEEDEIVINDDSILYISFQD